MKSMMPVLLALTFGAVAPAGAQDRNDDQAVIPTTDRYPI